MKAALEHRGRAEKLGRLLGSHAKEGKARYYALMLFLAAISSSGASSRSLFRFVGELEVIVGRAIASVFRRVDVLISKWSYKQSKACSLAASIARDKQLKGFLGRLSQALSIGVNVSDFIKVEYSKYMLSYEQDYARSMDKLKMYSDAYVALLNSNVMIFVTALLISVIFGSADVVSTLMGALMVIAATTAFMNVLLQANTPPGSVVHDQKPKPERLEKLEAYLKPALLVSLALIFVPIPLIAAGYGDAFLSSVPHASKLFPVPAFMLSSGALSLVVGLAGRRAVGSVLRIDAVYPVFIKTLGDSIAIAGSLREGVRRILYNDYGLLNPLIRKLYTRLKMGVDQALSWRIFSAETGSSLVWLHNMVFFYALKKGSKPGELTRIVFDSATGQLALRERRAQVAGYLKGSLVPLQGTFVAILTLITVLLRILGEFSRMVAGYVKFIGVPNMQMVELFVATTVIALTVGNAVALYVVHGDSKFTFLYYLGLLAVISGAVYFAVSDFASQMLGMFAGFGERVAGSVPGP